MNNNMFQFIATISPSYTLAQIKTCKRATLGSSLQRYPFSGLVHSAGELLHIPALHLQEWLGIGHPLKRHPFSGLVHSAGELLHTP